MYRDDCIGSAEQSNAWHGMAYINLLQRRTLEIITWRLNRREAGSGFVL